MVVFIAVRSWRGAGLADQRYEVVAYDLAGNRSDALGGRALHGVAALVVVAALVRNRGGAWAQPAAHQVQPECRRGSNGHVACGYNCRGGSDGWMVCAQ